MGQFHDRSDAGRQLGEQLQNYRDGDALVLGLPRGGVKVAEQISLALGCDLDVIVSRKLRAPGQPELAIGALAEGGNAVWNEELIADLGLEPHVRDQELARVREELHGLCAEYRSVLEKAPISGRDVILTDDGVATGATLRAALAAIADADPRRLVVALPGGPRETLARIASMGTVHDIIGLVSPNRLRAVGQLYDIFDQVNSGQMEAMLRNAARRRRAATAGRLRQPTRK